MKFAILGSGNVGTAIARALTDGGHEVVVSAPSAGSVAETAEEVPVDTTTSNRDAVKGAEVVVLAVPFDAVQDICGDLRDSLAGKIVIDVTNPIAPDMSGLSLSDTSAAELAQQTVPDARVVKAFNTVLAGNQATGTVDGTQLDGFVAGDDEEAKQTVLDLLGQIGFRPLDVGPLSAARYLEGMAFLNIALNARNGWPWGTGWKLVGPTA